MDIFDIVVRVGIDVWITGFIIYLIYWMANYRDYFKEFLKYFFGAIFLLILMFVSWPILLFLEFKSGDIWR